MSYEMLGIIATFVVLGSVLAVVGASTIDIDLGTDEFEFPRSITSSTNTDNYKTDGFYEWCYKMNIKC